ncbi:hypothetical protein E2C01_000017 [Portunus trituberculatus]|uniref:Uncharacterized protein n=1 Tax=Portunus trituberculatus TaxID=210409 RepID=A0A5B7CDR5_PORTR|nr:hypothetical protein [Portunus trituberculatus]
MKVVVAAMYGRMSTPSQQGSTGCDGQHSRHRHTSMPDIQVIIRVHSAPPLTDVEEASRRVVRVLHLLAVRVMMLVVRWDMLTTCASKSTGMEMLCFRAAGKKKKTSLRGTINEDCLMASVRWSISNSSHIHKERLLKQAPDVVGVVDFLHFYFSVNVAMVEEIDIDIYFFPPLLCGLEGLTTIAIRLVICLGSSKGVLQYLDDTLGVCHHRHYVVKGNETVAFYLCVHVLAFRQRSQEVN